MPDDRIKISALPSALSLTNTDVLAIVQGMNEGDTKVTRKAALTILAAHLLEVMEFNDLETASKTIVGGLNSLLNNLADEYDDTQSYDVGECVFYNGLLYQCIAEITIPEAWTAAHWTQIKAVDAGAGGFSIDVIADEYDSSLTYAVGDYVIYQDQLYKCNTAITSPEAWTAAHWTLTQVGPQLQTKADVTAVDEAIDNLLPVGNASGSVANFSTGLSKPLEALKAGFVATQASGTPTPSTPIPISGWSQIGITRCGSNLCNQAEIVSSYPSKYTVDADGSIKTVGNLSVADVLWTNKSKVSGVLNVIFVSKYQNAGSVGIRPKIIYTDGTNSVIYPTNTQDYSIRNLLTTSGKTVERIVVDYGTNNPTNFFLDVTLDKGATTYDSYNGITVPIALGGTCYGGYVTQDKYGHTRLVITHGYIASYDGETINEPWISSKDVYVPGATPTSGAQVVYPLTEPVNIDLQDGVPIETLIGVNNLFADSGDILECKYKDTIQHYIDAQIAATQALIL